MSQSGEVLTLLEIAPLTFASPRKGVNEDTVQDYFKGREPTLYGRNKKFEGLSTTADTYRPWEIKAGPPPRAPPAPGPSAPFDGTSSYKQDYPAHPLASRPPPTEVSTLICTWPLGS